MKKTELKEVEELLSKGVENFLQDKIEDFSLISKVKSPIQVRNKIQSSMMKARPPMHNQQINFSKISKDFQTDSGKYKYSDLEPQPTTLPATISNEIRSAGISDIEWTDIKNLPMGMNRDIQIMGEVIFSSFGLKKDAKIHTVSALKDNDLLNSNLELNSLLGFLEKNTQKVFNSPAQQIFDSPSTHNQYKPKLQLYYTPNQAYLAVFEEEGQGMEGKYIYTFERDPKLSLKNDLDKIEPKTKKLKNI